MRLPDPAQVRHYSPPSPHPGRRGANTPPLSRTHPQLARQWHSDRNGALHPRHVSAGSLRRVWWRCPEGPDHEWVAAVVARTNLGSGCPFCVGRQTSKTASLAHRFPTIAAEWHPTLNRTLKPRDVTPGSAKPAWWRCRRDPRHLFPATPSRRTRRRMSCPFCLAHLHRGEVVRTLAEAMPVLREHWHPTRNAPRTVHQLGQGPDRPVWWSCPANPSRPWRAPVLSWAGRASCDFCASRRIPLERTLAFKFAALAAEWHPTRNGKLAADQVVPKSRKRVWWRCRGRPPHVWVAPVHARVVWAARPRVRECSRCREKRRLQRTSLAARFPAVAAEWHPTRNRELTTRMVHARSRRRVWWRCRRSRDHEWAVSIDRRTARARPGCPFCARKRVALSHSLARRYPALAAEWHTTKNRGLGPGQVSATDHRSVWWRCRRGPDHLWRAPVRGRTARAGRTSCPFCLNKGLSVTNSLAVRFPAVAAQWHPTKNGALTPDHVLGGTHRRVWWLCPRGPDHEWNTSIDSRTSRGSGCPACRGLQVSATNTLAVRFPDVAAEWHPTLNRPLTPDRIVSGSNRGVWWRCAVDPAHVWRSAVVSRTSARRGCPECGRQRGVASRRARSTRRMG